MFGLMKQSKSMSGDVSSVKGSVLGSSFITGAETINPVMTALVQLCACVLPQMSGATMTGLERALKMEPRQKPALRKFIADSYSAPSSMGTVVRRYKRAASPSHDDCYRLAASLCTVSREAGRADSRSVANVIGAAKALGLNQDEVLSVLQKARLTA